MVFPPDDSGAANPSPDDSVGRPLLEVGRITKAHGLRGEVVVVLSTDREERVDAGSVLLTDRGPLTVVASRPHQDRWLVTFEGLGSREDGEALRGLVLRAEPLDDDDVLWVHDLVGSKVVTADGAERGTVVEVEENPAADLLVLDTGHLVPVVFVVDGPNDGVVTVDTPEGLFDLAADT